MQKPEEFGNWTEAKSGAFLSIKKSDNKCLPYYHEDDYILKIFMEIIPI